MSGLIDLNEITLFGLVKKWGDQVFSGVFNAGTVTDESGNLQSGSFEQEYVWEYTHCGFLCIEKEYREVHSKAYPKSKLNSDNSYIGVGNEASIDKVYRSDWLSSNKNTKAIAHYSLYNMVAQSLKMEAYKPEYQNLPVPTERDGVNYYYHDYDNYVFGGITSSSNGTVSVAKGQKDEGISLNLEYEPIGNASVNNSSLTKLYTQPLFASSSNSGNDNSVGLGVEFKFLGKSTPIFVVNNASKSTISTSNTNGTKTDTSTTQQASVSFKTGETLEESATFDDAGIKTQESSSLTSAWKGVWNNATSVNFSKSTGSIADNTKGFTLTENFGAIEPTGYHTTTDNFGDTVKTNLYEFDTPWKDPDTGIIKNYRFQVIDGAWYKWTLKHNQSNIKSIVSGQYTLQTPLDKKDPFITDDSGNSQVSLRVPQAMFSLDDYDMSQLGFTSSPVEEYQDSNHVKITDPADVNNIQYALINGSTTASASVSSNYELQLQSIVSDASDNSSSRLSAKRKSSKSSDKVSLKDLLIHDPSESDTTLYYDGSAGDDVVRDAHGVDHIHTHDGSDHVVIQGNKVQLKYTSGDYVDLGDGSDKLKVKASQGTNSFDAGKGADLIIDSKANLRGKLGDGDDTYKYAGGADFIELGKGNDKIKIDKSVEDGKLVIHDFAAGLDRITGLSSRKSYFKWSQKYQSFRLRKDDGLSVDLHTYDDSNKAVSPEFWLGVGLFNHDLIDLSSNNAGNWKRIRNLYAKNAIDESLQYQEWGEFSSNPDLVRNTLYSYFSHLGHENISNEDLALWQSFVDKSDSYASLYSSLVGPSLNSLA